MHKFFHPLAGIALLAAILACNLPSQQGISAATTALAQTAAAETVQAALTQAAQSSSSSPAATATFTSIPSPLPTVPLPTLPPPPTSTQTCDKAQFISENYPDDTVVAPGTSFTKTWTFKNVGVCSWTPGYAIVFSSGDSMSGPATQALAGNVNPGQTADISVALTAPSTSGTYKGIWKLRNASGVVFVNQFWVQIKVASSSSGFDLYTHAPDASWIGSAGAVTFGGPDTDPNGFAMYKSGQKLEDGSSPSKILETHPQWVDDGVMSGIYPAYTVTAGEHFTAKIGFLAMSDGSCGAGNAIFQFNYKESGTIHPLGSWTETCDGTMRSVDVNLSGIAGHTVQFTLAVLANGSSGQDWAVWVKPQVAIP